MFTEERMLSGLGVIAAVARSGSFARAAEVLDMTPSGVSRAVARLEAKLGLRLFERTTRSVALTADGRRLHEQVTPLLSGLADAVDQAVRGRLEVRGRLRVNVHPFVSSVLLGPRLGKFLERHPGLRLELMTRDDIGDIVADGFDLAIRFGDPPPSRLVSRKLLQTRILTVASPEYLRHRALPRVPTDISTGQHVCIQYRNPESGRPFTFDFKSGRRRVELDVDASLMVNDVATMHEVCLAGYGIAQVMELGVEHHLKAGRLVELLPEWSGELFPLFALFPHRNHLPAKTRAFIDFVASVAAEG